MNEQELREQLEQLAAAVNTADAGTSDKLKLQELIDSIESQLSNPVVDAEPVSLADQVDGMVSTFEADHPTVAAILNNIMVTLTSMGI